jgi:hypothetical protein
MFDRIKLCYVVVFRSRTRSICLIESSFACCGFQITDKVHMFDRIIALLCCGFQITDKVKAGAKSAFATAKEVAQSAKEVRQLTCHLAIMT